MSIPIEIGHLRTAAERQGTTPYLLTVGDDGRPHSVAVSAHWEDGELIAEAGRRTAANVRARGVVSLLWPPREPGGYSLIVDGDGGVEGAGESVRVVVRPTRGILHRSAAAPVATPDGCRSDCKPILR